MDGFNQVLTRSFEAVVSPMYAWPLLTLLLLAIVSGILMSLVFKYVSNQQALATVLDRGRGNALAIKLFKDDMRGVLQFGECPWTDVKANLVFAFAGSGTVDSIVLFVVADLFAL